jgi:hypothetical protein
MATFAQQATCAIAASFVLGQRSRDMPGGAFALEPARGPASTSQFVPGHLTAVLGQRRSSFDQTSDSRAMSPASHASLSSNRSAASSRSSISESIKRLNMSGSKRCAAPFRGCARMQDESDAEEIDLNSECTPEFVQRVYIMRFTWIGNLNETGPPELAGVGVLAHRYIVHQQRTFNLDVDLLHPHHGYCCLPVDHDSIRDRVDIVDNSVYARDMLEAELFVREFNKDRTQYKTHRLHNGMATCTLSRAFISNRNLVNCQRYICELFEHLCPCCLGAFHQSGGVCAITQKQTCWDCGSQKKHNACMARIQMQYLGRAGAQSQKLIEKHLAFNRSLVPPGLASTEAAS